MGKNSFFNFTLSDLWKFIGLTLICFLALHLYFSKFWAQESMIQVDYFTQEEKAEHPSAELSFPKRESLCLSQPSLCEKIVRSGTVSEEEKLDYTAQYLKIISFLDQHLQRGNDIKKAFQTLIINGEKGKRRGGATWKRITMNLASLGDPSEFWGVLTHEFGHIVDLGVLQGLSHTQNGNYTEFGKVKFAIDDPSLEYYRYSRENETIRSASAKKKDFCSGYGMTNPFEDFAECHNLFLNNKKLFKAMAGETPVMKNKYNYFANLFNNQVLQLGDQELLYKEWRPWDTTVI